MHTLDSLLDNHPRLRYLILMNEKWSPQKEWWMDLLKAFVSFAVIAFITSLVLDRYSERQAKRRSQDDAAFRLRVDALREFRRATLVYDVAAHSAFADLFQWKGKQKTDTMLHYEQDAFAGWKSAIEEALLREKDDNQLRDALSGLTNAVQKRHLIYDGLVDTRLDGDETTPIDPDSKRSEFKRLSQEISARRAQALDRFGFLVLQRPRTQ